MTTDRFDTGSIVALTLVPTPGATVPADELELAAPAVQLALIPDPGEYRRRDGTIQPSMLTTLDHEGD